MQFIKTHKIAFVFGVLLLIGLLAWYFYKKKTANLTVTADTSVTPLVNSGTSATPLTSTPAAGTSSNAPNPILNPVTATNPAIVTAPVATGNSIRFIKAVAVPNMSDGQPYFGKLQLIVAYPNTLKVGDTVNIISDNGTYSGNHKITYIYNNPGASVSALYFLDVNFVSNATGTITR